MPPLLPDDPDVHGMFRPVHLGAGRHKGGMVSTRGKSIAQPIAYAEIKAQLPGPQPEVQTNTLCLIVAHWTTTRHKGASIGVTADEAPRVEKHVLL